MRVASEPVLSVIVVSAQGPSILVWTGFSGSESDQSRDYLIWSSS